MPTPEETAVLSAAREWADLIRDQFKLDDDPLRGDALNEDIGEAEQVLYAAVNAWQLKPRGPQPANTNCGPAG